LPLNQRNREGVARRQLGKIRGAGESCPLRVDGKKEINIYITGKTMQNSGPMSKAGTATGGGQSKQTTCKGNRPGSRRWGQRKDRMTEPGGKGKHGKLVKREGPPVKNANC